MLFAHVKYFHWNVSLECFSVFTGFKCWLLFHHVRTFISSEGSWWLFNNSWSSSRGLRFSIFRNHEENSGQVMFELGRRALYSTCVVNNTGNDRKCNFFFLPICKCQSCASCSPPREEEHNSSQQQWRQGALRQADQVNDNNSLWNHMYYLTNQLQRSNIWALQLRKLFHIERGANLEKETRQTNWWKWTDKVGSPEAPWKLFGKQGQGSDDSAGNNQFHTMGYIEGMKTDPRKKELPTTTCFTDCNSGAVKCTW